MSEWKPISTAPNREDVLVFSTEYGICIARRATDEWSRDLGYAADVEEAFYLNEAKDAGLTHWMPLPEPPK